MKEAECLPANIEEPFMKDAECLLANIEWETVCEEGECLPANIEEQFVTGLNVCWQTFTVTAVVDVQTLGTNRTMSKCTQFQPAIFAGKHRMWSSL